jgi:cell division protein FtsZ
MGLLKRITNSLGRRDEDPAFDDMMAPAAAAPQQRRAPSPEASLYAPRRGQLDDQGRQVPAARMTSHEDDQLEIPAFLRRQSN